MHRFSWDLRYDPVDRSDDVPGGDVDATGAVPHRTYPASNAPWVPTGPVHGAPDGEWPDVDAADRRAHGPAGEDLAGRAGAAQRAVDGDVRTRGLDARRVQAGPRTDHATRWHVGTDVTALKTKVEGLAPANALPRNVRNARRRAPAGAPVHLESASNAALAAALAMQSADVAPTATQIAGVTSARSQTATTLAAWNTLRQTESGRVQRRPEVGRSGDGLLAGLTVPE